MKEEERHYHYWKKQRQESRVKYIFRHGVIGYGLLLGVITSLFNLIVFNEDYSPLGVSAYIFFWLIMGGLKGYWDCNSNEKRFQKNRQYHERLETRREL